MRTFSFYGTLDLQRLSTSAFTNIFKAIHVMFGAFRCNNSTSKNLEFIDLSRKVGMDSRNSAVLVGDPFIIVWATYIGDADMLSSGV